MCDGREVRCLVSIGLGLSLCIFVFRRGRMCVCGEGGCGCECSLVCVYCRVFIVQGPAFESFVSVCLGAVVS